MSEVKDTMVNCRRPKCDGKLILVEFIERNLFNNDTGRIMNQEVFIYTCAKCNLRHSLEGMK